MDPAILSALSAVMGSVVGGAASLTTAWVTQQSQTRRSSIEAELRKREALYGRFINECSRLAIDALDHTLDNPQAVIEAVALINKMRFIASLEVLEAADNMLKGIMAQYYSPNMTGEEIRDFAVSGTRNPLKIFGDKCREELALIQSGRQITLKISST